MKAEPGTSAGSFPISEEIKEASGFFSTPYYPLITEIYSFWEDSSLKFTISMQVYLFINLNLCFWSTQRTVEKKNVYIELSRCPVAEK